MYYSLQVEVQEEITMQVEVVQVECLYNLLFLLLHKAIQ